MHSARLHEPEELRGKRVTVVGGGASGWDLLDLAIENDAKDIHWVYRSMRWFMPTAKSIVAHILGECEIPKKRTPHLVAYWDLHRHFARFDGANYPPVWWRLKYFLLACWYALRRDKTVTI